MTFGLLWKGNKNQKFYILGILIRSLEYYAYKYDSPANIILYKTDKFLKLSYKALNEKINKNTEQKEQNQKNIQSENNFSRLIELLNLQRYIEEYINESINEKNHSYDHNPKYFAFLIRLYFFIFVAFYTKISLLILQVFQIISTIPILNFLFRISIRNLNVKITKFQKCWELYKQIYMKSNQLPSLIVQQQISYIHFRFGKLTLKVF